MKCRISCVLLTLLTVISFSCHNDGFKETPGGLKYKIIRTVNGPAFREGEYVVLNMEYYYSGDSLLYSSIVRGMPVTMLYDDSVWNKSGQVYEGFSMLKVGDSALFMVQCEDLYLKSFRMPVPSGLNPKETITFRVGVTSTMNDSEFREYQGKLVIRRQEEREKRQSEQLIEDTAIIDKYLEEKNIIPMESESGLRYVVNKQGAGPKPKQGEIVVINYKGMLLDGTVFESSEITGKPYEFPVGNGVIIKGWDEGVSMMREGSSYTFYLPSPLAYGDRNISNFIKPNSILVYEVELVQIKRN
ncbi:MAG TPA: FKBP-type peptidyl-prolyl cis-trans isomerase [Cyclobacteriaceae bacterium]|nr:FKBP-type peptidyl-prolyl cis-trans isomerase [Cyclobacteriaceae bacterium]